MVCIRRATLADMPEIKACALLCFPQENPDTIYSFFTDSIRLQLVYVADSGGRIVGHVVAMMIENKSEDGKEGNKEEECREGYISSLGVHPTHRKSGIAVKLMNAAENAMVQEYSCEYVCLRVLVNNLAAINLYTKILGYDTAAKCQVDGEDAYLMKKQLPGKLLLDPVTVGPPLASSSFNQIHEGSQIRHPPHPIQKPMDVRMDELDVDDPMDISYD